MSKLKIDQAARLALFSHQAYDKYEELTLEDGVYVKQWNGSKKCWQVARYTFEGFDRYSAYRANHQPKKKTVTRVEIKVKKKKLTRKEQREKKLENLNRIYDLLGAPQNKIPYKQTELF